MEDYRTIRENGIHEIEIKKSRFICHLRRVKSEEEAQVFIEEVKKEHWKATHNCSAYTIGLNDEIQRAHDDGEPSGTAGVPMLEIFLKRELKMWQRLLRLFWWDETWSRWFNSSIWWSC